MGRFATCTLDDDIETCLSALKSTIELYEEDIAIKSITSNNIATLAKY